MDGVLADFVGGALAAHKSCLHTLQISWNFQYQIGFAEETEHEFWKPFNFDFWSKLKRHEDGFTLLKKCEELIGKENIALLTSPSNNEDCIDGKRSWVKSHLPDYKRRVFTGSDKHMLAAENKILIDDHDKNCDKFEKFGGWSVIVPRSWNRRRELINEHGHFDPDQVFQDVLSKIST